jgi:hypothetical protein
VEVAGSNPAAPTSLRLLRRLRLGKPFERRGLQLAQDPCVRKVTLKLIAFHGQIRRIDYRTGITPKAA